MMRPCGSIDGSQVQGSLSFPLEIQYPPTHIQGHAHIMDLHCTTTKKIRAHTNSYMPDLVSMIHKEIFPQACSINTKTMCSLRSYSIFLLPLKFIFRKAFSCHVSCIAKNGSPLMYEFMYMYKVSMHVISLTSQVKITFIRDMVEKAPSWDEIPAPPLSVYQGGIELQN